MNTALFDELTVNTKLQTRVMFWLFLKGWSLDDIRRATVLDVRSFLQSESPPQFDQQAFLFIGVPDEQLAFSYASGRLITPSRLGDMISSIVEKTGEYSIDDINTLRRNLL